MLKPDKHSLKAQTDDFELDLMLKPVKPPVAHGKAGYSLKGVKPESACCYYSFTRLEVSGRLNVKGNAVAIKGIAWMDHEFSSAPLEPDIVGWDWFSLQFDDNTELMMFILHTKDAGAQLTGCTFVDEQGCAHDLEQFELQSLRTWHSPHTGGDYPLDWTLSVPGAELDVEITVTFDDQEMDTRATTLNTYWEGEVTASGTRAGKPVAGLGYVELAGYGPWGP